MGATVLFTLLLALALLSVVLNLWQWYAGRRFPLHRTIDTEFAPKLSILRPLKGCDSETERCLESWFVQSYRAPYELLFAVVSESDPICEIVERLRRKYPAQPVELIFSKPVLGANGKVSSLCYLAKKAQHEHVVISDQDVVIPHDFLSQFVQPLAKKSVGLVNSFYKFAHPPNLPMRLEAVAVNADFWTQVLQGNMLKPMDFALGAVMGTTRTHLQQIGGFEALLDYLADDYQLGNRIAKAGGTLEICPVPVQCRSAPQNAADVWQHQLRWARTIRACQPAPYFFSILGNATLWPLLFLALDQGRISAAIAFIALVLRIATAAHNYHRLTGESGLAAGLLASIKDLLQVVVWGLSFVGNGIIWGGERFRLTRGGKLTRLA